MKKLKFSFFVTSLLILFFSISLSLYGDPDGRTGRTRKTSTSGCGGCHGSSAATDVSALLNGPDTITAGTTRQFSLTVSKPSKTGAGLDIATRKGVLAPVSSNIHLTNGELTHNNNIPFTGGSATVQFNYTAPALQGTDTLWATGLATNSDGGSGGDDWNWAVSKRIIVILATGVTENNSGIRDFSISQNYPNPFNPNTIINYQIPKPGFVTLKIYDVLGNEIAVLVNRDQNQGSYDISFDGSNLAGGVYYYTINLGDFRETKSMLLIK
ncbi:MAG TPA: T9SS type A sorting domain-containing protein [Ignavibacteria bacterium]|nr:T9SS type A sorting domain-containing protein [Ignavibacteria bacterium]